MDTHRHHPPLNPRQVSHGDSPSVPRGRSPLPTHCWRKIQTATHQTRGRLEERPALLLRFLSCPLGRRPTVGPQTLDLLIGVRIPASQLELRNFGIHRTQERTHVDLRVRLYFAPALHDLHWPCRCKRLKSSPKYLSVALED